MTLTTNTYIERVLITLNPDGSLKGAHQESLSEIKDGGTVLTARQEPAVTLTAEALALVLPDHAALLAQIDALTKERDALRNQVKELTNDAKTLAE